MALYPKIFRPPVDFKGKWHRVGPGSARALCGVPVLLDLIATPIYGDVDLPHPICCKRCNRIP